jgi:hypothetical protein
VFERVRERAIGDESRKHRLVMIGPGVRGERHTRRASAFVPRLVPLDVPQVAFPGGAVRRRVHSVQQWCQLVESTYVAWAVYGNHRMKGDCAPFRSRSLVPEAERASVERSGAARRGRRRAPRPARGGGGAGRDITRSMFSRGSASASQVTLKNTR